VHLAFGKVEGNNAIGSFSLKGEYGYFFTTCRVALGRLKRNFESL